MTDPVPAPAATSEQALKRAAAVGQALAKAKHDLNNLFHVARGWSRLLSDPRTRPEQVQEGIEAVLTASARTSELIGGILSLEMRPSAGLELCDLGRRLSEFGHGLAYLLPAPERLAQEIAAPPLVACDFAEIRAALLDFAIAERERTSDFGLRLELSCEPGLVRLRLGRQTVDPSAPERAVHFEFSTEVAPVSAEVSEPSQPRATPISVLLVDDHRDVRRLATTILERAGYSVLTASDAEEALETSRAYDGPIQILYCDARTPGLSAPNLIAELRAARPDLRVLVCTSEQAPEALEGYVQLHKPFSSQQLLDAIRRCQD